MPTDFSNKSYKTYHNVFELTKQLSTDIHIHAHIVFGTDTFLEFQHDIIQEGIAEINDEILELEDLSIQSVKSVLENQLQRLNATLSAFAQKIKDTTHFEIQGFLEVIVQDTLLSSLIGNVSLLIVRNSKLYYTLSNSFSTKDKIDLFSEFIEGELETGDRMIVMGGSFDHIFDTSDVQELNLLIQTQENRIVAFLEDIALSRVAPDQLGFIWNHLYTSNKRSSSAQFFAGAKKSILKQTNNSPFFSPQFLTQHKFTLIVGGLCIVLLTLIRSFMSSLLLPTYNTTIQTASGTVVLTIEDIKKDIALFQRIDPTKNEKSEQYRLIGEKIALLESKNKRPDDIAQLKKLLQNEYYRGFNIIPFTNLQDLGVDQIFTFTPQELQALGQPLSLIFDKTLFIGGLKGVLLGVVNNEARGSVVELASSLQLVNCALNLLRNGAYCFTKNGSIYNITKAGAEELITASGKFPDRISQIGAYGRNYLFVLNENISNLQQGNLLTRYSNVQGKQNEFLEGLNYSLGTGNKGSFMSGFSSLAIDGNFLVRDKTQKKLLQMRRDRPGANPSSIAIREIKLDGGDKGLTSLSDDVKVLSFQDVAEVYLFDRKNQTFTVYTSNPTKKNDSFRTTYNLVYQYRIQFDLTDNNVIDVAIGQPGINAQLYIMTQKGIHKLQLSELVEDTLPSPSQQ